MCIYTDGEGLPGERVKNYIATSGSRRRLRTQWVRAEEIPCENDDDDCCCTVVATISKKKKKKKKTQRENNEDRPLSFERVLMAWCRSIACTRASYIEWRAPGSRARCSKRTYIMRLTAGDDGGGFYIFFSSGLLLSLLSFYILLYFSPTHIAIIIIREHACVCVYNKYTRPHCASITRAKERETKYRKEYYIESLRHRHHRIIMLNFLFL